MSEILNEFGFSNADDTERTATYAMFLSAIEGNFYDVGALALLREAVEQADLDERDRGTLLARIDYYETDYLRLPRDLARAPAVWGLDEEPAES